MTGVSWQPLPNSMPVSRAPTPTRAERFFAILDRWASDGAPGENRAEAKRRISTAWMPMGEALELNGLQLRSLPDCLGFLPSSLRLIVDDHSLCDNIALPAGTLVESLDQRVAPAEPFHPRSDRRQEFIEGRRGVFKGFFRKNGALIGQGMSREEALRYAKDNGTSLDVLQEKFRQAGTGILSAVHLHRKKTSTKPKEPSPLPQELPQPVKANRQANSSQSSRPPANPPSPPAPASAHSSAFPYSGSAPKIDLPKFDPVVFDLMDQIDKLAGVNASVGRTSRVQGGHPPALPPKGTASAAHSRHGKVQASRREEPQAARSYATPSLPPVADSRSTRRAKGKEEKQVKFRGVAVPAPTNQAAPPLPGKSDEGRSKALGKLPAPVSIQAQDHPRRRSDRHHRDARVRIEQPTAPTPMDTWNDSRMIATFSPLVPIEGNKRVGGMTMQSVSDPGKQVNAAVAELKRTTAPQISLSRRHGATKHGHLPHRAGVVIRMPGRDGRIVVVEPSNHFFIGAGFPQGGIEGLSGARLPHDRKLEITAIKEAYEESGLLVDLQGHLGDFNIGGVRYRMFVGEPIRGAVTDMDWETQSVSLVPARQLTSHIGLKNRERMRDTRQMQLFRKLKLLKPNPAQPEWEANLLERISTIYAYLEKTGAESLRREFDLHRTVLIAELNKHAGIPLNIEELPSMRDRSDRKPAVQKFIEGFCADARRHPGVLAMAEAYMRYREEKKRPAPVALPTL